MAWHRLRSDERFALKKKQADPNHEVKEKSRKAIGQKGRDLYRLLFSQKTTRLNGSDVINLAGKFNPPVQLSMGQANEILVQVEYTKPVYSEPASGVFAFAFPEFLSENGVALWMKAMEHVKLKRPGNKLLQAQRATTPISIIKYPMKSQITSSFFTKAKQPEKEAEKEPENEHEKEKENEASA